MTDIVVARKPFIRGRFLSGDAGTFSVEDPTTGDVFAEVDGSTPVQFGAAILAAREAFDLGPWPTMAVIDRVSALRRFADAVAEQQPDLIETAIAEVGLPRAIAAGLAGLAIDGIHEFCDLFATLPEYEHNEIAPQVLLAAGRTRLSLRRYEPVGVVAAITAYNAPLLFNIWKLVPALLAGCTTVLRPSPLTPLEAFALAAAAEQAELPVGVLNVVAEAGVAGAHLMTTHPAVDLVSFTGSVPVGRRIAAQAAPTLKRVVLELGGKSVQLHMPDVSVESIVESVVATVSGNAGQACVLQSRVLVPQVVKQHVLEALQDAVPRIRIGDPRDSETQLGPLITREHRDRVAALVADGIDSGARLVAGGHLRSVPDRGWFYPPSVLDIADNNNPVARREVFGPVVTVQGYCDPAHAIGIANDSEYGLSNGVYGIDVERAFAVATRLRSGEVRVNERGTFGVGASIGGYKQSGLGRERGVQGIRAFQETKHIAVSG